MASGVGIAVGVTVEPLDAAPWPEDLVDPEATSHIEPLVAWLPRRRTTAESAALLQQITAAEAQLTALKLDLALDIAAARPAPADPRPGEARAADVGPPGVSEFALDELALVLTTSRTAAVTLLDQAHILATRLPATRAELATGRLDWPRARGIAAELGRPADDTDRRSSLWWRRPSCRSPPSCRCGNSASSSDASSPPATRRRSTGGASRRGKPLMSASATSATA